MKHAVKKRSSRGAGKRKVCFVITSPIHYSRNMLVLQELEKRADVELHIIIGGTGLLSRYSLKDHGMREMLETDGHTNIHEIHFALEGDLPIVKGKTVGLGILEFSTLFNNLKPDIVVVRGDRFEVLAATVAAAYSNIPIAHIEGGDISGTIDESVRHAITKFSHIHFPTNDASRARVIRMGENAKYVFNFGSPDVEVARTLAKENHPFDVASTGSGAPLDTSQDYLIVMYHPVASELEKANEHARILVHAVHETGIPTLWFWPNPALGSEAVFKEIRIFNDQVKDHKIRFLKDIPPREFIWLLKNSRCLVGNSSAGMKECSYLGIPVVNIGSRQNGRLKAENVVEVLHDAKHIKAAIKKQAAVGRYPASNLYHSANTAKNIARVVATTPLYVQKAFVQ